MAAVDQHAEQQEGCLVTDQNEKLRWHVARNRWTAFLCIVPTTFVFYAWAASFWM